MEAAPLLFFFFFLAPLLKHKSRKPHSPPQGQDSVHSIWARVSSPWSRLLAPLFPKIFQFFSFFIFYFMAVCVHACKVALVVSDSLQPMDCRPPGSSIHGILQAKVLEWVAMLSSKDLPDPGTGLASPALAGGFFTTVLLMKPSLENSWLTVLCLRCPAQRFSYAYTCICSFSNSFPI